MTARRLAPPIGFGVAIVLGWELLTQTGAIKASVLPSPSSVADRGWELRAFLWPNFLTTLQEILAGFVIGSAAGFLLGMAVAYVPPFRRSIYPYLVIAQVVPKVALAPLFLIWLGYGLEPKIAIAALICFFPVVTNTTQGFQSVPAEWDELMAALGARRHEYFFKVSLPHTLPYLFAALKVSISLAVIGAVVGELVGADQGLGHVLNLAIANFDLGMEFAALSILIVIGLVIFGAIALAERALFGWEPQRRSSSNMADVRAVSKESVPA
jgi:NitT/TauT family transport system permease protein